MEDAHQIVLQALEQAGVELPSGVDSVQDLPSSSLISIASKALTLILGPSSPPLPTSLPQSMADRFRICNDLAAAIKQLGYRGDLSFHQFLYPSDEETYKLLRFLLDHLSKSSSSDKERGSRKGRGSKFTQEGITASKTLTVARHALSLWLEEAHRNIEASALPQQGTDSSHAQSLAARVPFRTCPLRLATSNPVPGKKTPALITLQAKPKSLLVPSVLELNVKNALHASTLLDGRLAHLAQGAQNSAAEGSGDFKLVSHGSLNVASNSDGTVHAAHTSSSLLRAARFSKDRDMILLQGRILQGDSEGDSSNQGTTDSSDAQGDPWQRELTRLEEKLSALTKESTKLAREGTELDLTMKEVELEFEALSEQLVDLKRKYSILKVAVDMVLDTSASEDSKIQKLQISIEASQQQLAILKAEWVSLNRQLEEKKLGLESSAQSGREETQMKLKQVKEIRQQIKDMAGKLKQREEQLIALSLELENAVKGPSRNTYVRRITELIKNSKKQDNDITRIIGEIRDLQRESNANQGRLGRTYALVDELIFRDAKKDPHCRQAYRVLSSIHDNFGDCYGKVFLIDKVRREITELQATLETLEKWPVDLKKVQADIDAIVAENQSFEKKVQVMGKDDENVS